MKSILLFMVLLFTTGSLYAQHPAEPNTQNEMDRISRCKENYRHLFQGEALTGEGSDPEVMEILQKFIFGDIFATGTLDHKSRELITCTVLTVMQTMPQLKAHTGAALNVGVTPIELREAVYQCAPFIGFPKTLNAVATINEVFTERGITLPLDKQGSITEEERFERGKAIQYPIYGDEIAQAMAPLPAGMGDAVARFLTEYCFGDLYTRTGLNIQQRELLIYCILTTIGAAPQLQAHALGNLKIGNSREQLTAAVIQCLPYIGFPLALQSLKILRDLPDPTTESMKPIAK